ncbi:hypothetical protein FOMPIDRAFT_90551 [Fomitopsis schrenkii]|uniref:F-box domain-containing protein n=1 Tax=Fomitopsis schrenkii TaxID=2126942 RepID=S8F1R2_FOMSC|nr:hypothetical protein FOMPIDRAFT_90551 [Fomitopsis schrenkii]
MECGHSTDTRDLGALDLPYDILRRLFEQFSDEDTGIMDALCLSLTNSFLCEIGQHRVYDHLRAYHAPWYLDRIICIGDNHCGDDMPPGFGVIKDHEQDILCGDAAGHNQRGSRLFNADETTYNRDFAYCWESIFDGRLSRRLSEMECKRMAAVIKPDFSWDGRPETEWVLISWSAAEYVRASKVAELTNSRCDGPWTTQQCLGLGHVLITQISWSSDDSTGLVYQGPVHRGRWAGHHIAITTKDQLTEDEDLSSEGARKYTDVTDRVLKEVLDIWGPDEPGVLAEQLRPAAPAPSYDEFSLLFACYGPRR